MNASSVSELKTLLSSVFTASYDSSVGTHVQNLSEFIEQTPTPWRQKPSHVRGHITASAWILDHARTHAALLHHKKLGLWLQPGGHVEETDTSWIGASRREVLEETGLDVALHAMGEQLFDVYVHTIPARAANESRDAEPEHLHFDIRFLFVAKPAAVLQVNTEESEALRWFALDELIASNSLDTSVRRMAVASRKL